VDSAKRWWWHDGLVLVLVIFAVSLAWSSRIGGGDTFVGLAAGRDTYAGRVGLPDEWSFSTEGRVWLNQNWGAHTIYYTSHRLFGDLGPVAVKWAVICCTVLLMIRAATARGANVHFAAVAISIMILVPKSYLDVRPHIFTLLYEAALIVAMFRWYAGSPAWAWAGTAILWAWSNTHGGFVFGLSVMGLWLGVQGFLKLVTPDSRPWGWGHLAHLAGALAVAVALAALANPFGPINLTHPLVVKESKVWLSVQEWHPIIDWNTLKQAQGFGSVTEFLVMLGFFAAILVGWGVGRFLLTPTAAHGGNVKPQRAGGRQSPPPFRGPEVPVPVSTVKSSLFDLALTGLVLFMAFKARRFIPLATVAIAPIFAALFERMLWQFKRIICQANVELWTPMWRACLVGMTGALLATAAYMSYDEIYLPYHDPNPAYPKQTVLMRMVAGQTFPEKAMDFLTQQDIPQELFVDWRWEGYTRWRSEKLKTFSGGRAQQIHSERVAAWQIGIVDVNANPIRSFESPAGYQVDTGQVGLIAGQKDGTLAEMRLQAMPLARLVPALDVKVDGRTERLTADKTVRAAFAEVTDCWADIDVTVEKSTEPKFRAEYRLTIVADQPWFNVSLLRLTNIGSVGYHMVQHVLLMNPLRAGDPPVSGGPLAFYQGPDFRYGMCVSMSGGMMPYIEASGQGMRSEAVGMIGAPLGPSKEYAPERASILAFVHKVGRERPSQLTFGLLQNAQTLNCRSAVNQADQHKIKVFVLPRRSWGLARVLVGSRRWSFVFDDGTAFVLLRRGDPKNDKVISDVMAGKASFPDDFLKALGKGMAKSSMISVNADPSEFRKDLKAALDIRPSWLAYWMLQNQYIRDNRPEVVKESLEYWTKQWERVSKLPVDGQLGREALQAQQIVADCLANACGRLQRPNDVGMWRQRSQEAGLRIAQIQKRFM